MNEREEILKAIIIIQREHKTNVRDALVIYVLCDRRRIVEPLLNYKIEKISSDEWRESEENILIDQTIRNAGVYT